MRISFLLAAALMAVLTAGCSRAPETARAVDPQRDWVLGPKDAPVNVILYTDIECSSCKKTAGTVEEVVASFQGAANLAWRHFPQVEHGDAAVAEAVAAECVGAQQGPVAMVQFAYNEMAASRGDGKGLQGGLLDILSLAKARGLKNEKEFTECLLGDWAISRVKDDFGDAQIAGITKAPSVLIRSASTGRETLISGEAPASQITAAIKMFLPGGPSPLQ